VFFLSSVLRHVRDIYLLLNILCILMLFTLITFLNSIFLKNGYRACQWSLTHSSKYMYIVCRYVKKILLAVWKDIGRCVWLERWKAFTFPQICLAMLLCTVPTMYFRLKVCRMRDSQKTFFPYLEATILLVWDWQKCTVFSSKKLKGLSHEN